MLSMLMRLAVVLLALAAGALRAQTAAYVGAAVCGKCHAERFAGQSASEHAHALSRAADHPLAAEFVPREPLVRPPRFRFQYTREGGRLAVRVSDGADAQDLPVEWAFGAGDQAVTFVSRLDPDWYLEHYFSFYSDTRSLAATPGHEGYRSNTLALARGVLYRSTDPVAGVLRCFECHSTGPPKIGADRSIEPREMGVRCEACHGPGSRHAAAPSRQSIGNPARLTAVEINELCGRCHRTPDDGALANVKKAWNVRHQPIYLARSACFLKSKGKLSCLTCHDMHSSLSRDAAGYDAKCAGCHQTVKHSPASGYAGGASCSGCHMPRVSPQPHLAFTNHWIGVYRDEEKLEPR